MKLADFLSQTEQSPTAFAAGLGVPVSTVTRWLRGERRPSLDLLHKVYEATEGSVTASDFLAPAPEYSEALS